MRERILLLISLLVIVSPSASASHIGDLYVIPVAAHASGVNSSAWRTDVAIHNFQTTPITVELAVIESGEGSMDNFFPVSISGNDTLTVPAGGSRILVDVLNNHRGRAQTTGSLIIGADKPFVATSRTYIVDSTGTNRIGETIPAAHEFLSAATDTAFLPGLISDARFRTNIGFTASAGLDAPLVIEVSILGSGGNSLGSRTFAVPAGGANHLQFSSTSITNEVLSESTAVVRIVSGVGDVVPYASIVENSSNNAMFVSAVVPMTTVGSARASSFAEKLLRLSR